MAKAPILKAVQSIFRTAKVIAVTIERIWVFEGKSEKTFPVERERLVKLLSPHFKIDLKPSEKTSLAISLGGDGSMLSMIRHLGELRHKIKILGVHTSAGLGFLHRLALPANSKDFGIWGKFLIGMLGGGKFSVEKRWGVQAKLGRHQMCWGMNDLVISKGSLSRMVNLQLSVDGSLLFPKLRGDGLIVCSPTGTTAYSLAAGGPIVVPSIKGIIITPILPHEIAQRPVVLSADSKVEIEVLEGPPCFITEDGQRTTDLKVGQKFEVFQSEHPVEWLTPQGLGEVRDYFEMLRSKLGLGGGKSARND